MLAMGSGYVPEKYKDYKNRKFTHHQDKLKNQIRQINECSLKIEDKIHLKKILLQMLST